MQLKSIPCAVLFLTLATWLVDLGCTKPVQPTELPGLYEASSEAGTETLELRSDGEYLLRFKDRKGVELTENGHWRYEPYEGEPKVALEDYRPNLWDFGLPPAQAKGSLSLLGIERSWWGGIRLYASYSADKYYSKKARG